MEARQTESVEDALRTGIMISIHSEFIFVSDCILNVILFRYLKKWMIFYYIALPVFQTCISITCRVVCSCQYALMQFRLFSLTHQLKVPFVQRSPS